MQEFLPPTIYAKVIKTDDPVATFYQYVDKRIVELAEFYREYFDAPIIINNWHQKGLYTLRGFRPKSTKLGAKMSMHKFGKAFDCDVVGMSATEVRNKIRANKDLFYSKGLRRIENGVAWVHSDIKDIPQKTVIEFNP